MAYTVSESEKVYLTHAAEQNFRVDGRGANDFRPVDVETQLISSADGSARVRIAGTDVLAAVKADVATSCPDRPPDEGRIAFFVDFSALAGPEFSREAGAEDVAAEIASELTRAYDRRGSALLRRLCLARGERCWALTVDVTFYAADSNPCDAASLAVKAALYHTRLPRVAVVRDENNAMTLEVPDDAGTTPAPRFPMTDVPVIVSVCKIGKSLVVDCTHEEETCVSCCVRVAVAGGGRRSSGGVGDVGTSDSGRGGSPRVVAVHKCGEGGLNEARLVDMVTLGCSVAADLSDQLLVCLDGLERARDAGEDVAVGYLGLYTKCK